MTHMTRRHLEEWNKLLLRVKISLDLLCVSSCLSYFTLVLVNTFQPANLPERTPESLWASLRDCWVTPTTLTVSYMCVCVFSFSFVQSSARCIFAKHTNELYYLLLRDNRHCKLYYWDVCFRVSKGWWNFVNKVVKKMRNLCLFFYSFYFTSEQ